MTARWVEDPEALGVIRPLPNVLRIVLPVAGFLFFLACIGLIVSAVKS